MNTKDWSKTIGSDIHYRVPEEFVRYDKNGTVLSSLLKETRSQLQFTNSTHIQHCIESN